MTKTLTGDHAEDVGGVIVEPGAEIPKDADPEIVKRLEAEGRIEDSGGSKKSSKED